MNKEKLISFFIILITIIFFAGCATPSFNAVDSTAQKNDDELILIQSKAQIKNGNENNTVKIEIALWPKKAIRLEITGTLGVSIASVLFTTTEISYALHTTKQFAVGPFHEKTLYPVFKKNIDPRIVWKFINNQPMTNLNLKCSKVEGQQLMNCLALDGTLIKWLSDEYPRRRIDIIANKFEMNWIFRDQSPLVDSQNKTFVLKMPENYQEIIIK